MFHSTMYSAVWCAGFAILAALVQSTTPLERLRRDKQRFAVLCYRFLDARATCAKLLAALLANCPSTWTVPTEFTVPELPLYTFVRSANGGLRMIQRPQIGGGAETNGAKTRVLLVVNQELARLGIVSSLMPAPDIMVAGEAENPDEALAKAVALRPHVVVVNLEASDGEGVAVVAAIMQQCPGTKVLVLAGRAGRNSSNETMYADAGGHVVRDVTPEQLVRTIRALNGDPALDPRLAMRAWPTGPAPSVRNSPKLTAREVDILTGLVSGLSDKEIAAKLYLSESTVKEHLRRVYRRLNLRNRAQAAALVTEKGLLKH